MTGRITFLVLAVAAAALAVAEEPLYRNLDARDCPVLDTPFRHDWELNVSYTMPADTGTTGWGDELRVIDINWWVRLFLMENRSGGELEGQFRSENRVLEGFANASGSDSIYTLTMTRLFLQWSQRYVNGFGLQIHSAPGAYTGADSFDGESFSFPTGLKLIKAVTPNLAVFAGATVYPGFETSVDPCGGILYAIRDRLILQLAYPESRLEWSPASTVRFIFNGQLLSWPDYSLGGDAPRERVQFEEARVSGGVEFACTERIGLTLQGGFALERTLSFSEASPDVALEDAGFVMIGLTGRL
ncbi:MAG: hypothetical protein O3A51_03660 [Verrucomicrobia bacterium]|nr:hypothetical protein [Verrucomicrobiota bacterium]